MQDSLLKNSRYMRLWGSQALGALSQHTCVPIWPLVVLALTESAAAAGLVAAVRSLPFLLLSLPVGVLVDRYNRAKVLIASAAARLLVFVLLLTALLTVGPSVTLVFFVVALEGALFVVFNIAEVAALPSVVRKEQLASANAQNESANAVIQTAAPALGTALYQFIGLLAAALVSAACSAAALILVARLQLTDRTMPPTSGSFSKDLLAGFQWLVRARLIAFFALLTALLNFLSAGLGVIAVVAAKRHGASDMEVGVIFSLAGLGASLGAMAAPWIKDRIKLEDAIRGSVVLIACLVPVFAASANWIAIGATYFLICFISPIYNVYQITYRLERIPTELQGRVNSTYRLIAFGLFPLGAGAAGLLLDSGVSNAPALAFSFVAVVAAVLACSVVTPQRVAAAG